MIFLIFVMIYSCIGVHLLMQTFELIEDVNIRYVNNEVEY